ncbi:MAG TPA: transglutaminase family protein [Aliidongia sp.]|uniref:transglutaminase-like domain-containing protein n=1 Tax=Aliidongia sp. TaxID=1914230 RepID=UPI002DDD0C6D|nr:transglutaminase family protein [Aliidongia sp.]HEV2677355.1 transglutaminase family protein [Aliidongia sp.]
MKLRVGYELVYDCPCATPMILMLNTHFSRVDAVLSPDVLKTEPPVPVAQYRDGFGNLCSRILAPPGRISLSTEALLDVPDQPETMPSAGWQHPVEELPDDTLVFLLGSRYCETDLMSHLAWQMFGHLQGGRERVQAICDFVHHHIAFSYASARPTRTAWEAYQERSGVCRDYAHLALTLCRALNIPARYCTGYISDAGLPPTDAPMDFCAWFEAYLGGMWQTFDPRNNAPRTGRVLMARGRDAADIAISTNFGATTLVKFLVVCEPAVQGEAPAMALSIDEAYSSSNGDRWQVVRDPSAGRTLVRHIPNASSGGIAREFSVQEFLSVNGSGPEYAAVRHLIETAPGAGLPGPGAAL